MTEERKLVTVLFADIVGSTAIGMSHDPEVVRRSLTRAFSDVRHVLETHGGTVEKFIGDAVMAVFGIPQTHDDDADRAVRAAFALRDRIAALPATGRFTLDLRIGVNSGQVVTGDAGETLVTGEAVNAGARLQAAAAPNEILVGALTRQLTEGGVRYGAMREIEAKGIGRLKAWTANELASALPAQHRGIAGLRAPLIGRDDELRLLVESHRKLAADRRPILVTVFGNAGVGKSRLVAEFVEAIGSDRVRRGRCLPYGEGITFWPVVEVLRSDAGIDATDSQQDAARKLRAAVLAAFGDASEDAEAVARRLSVLAGTAAREDALPEVSGDSLPQELRWGLRRYLERRAAERPLIVVFDDIHWAEPALLDLIEDLAEWTRAPLFLLCMARPDLREMRAGWGGGLMNASAVRLEPLTPDESARLIRELLAIDALPDDLRAQVIARSEGNPLYVEEFLRMLIDGGHVAKRDDRFVATASLETLVVPATLQGLIAARLDSLPAAVKRVLQRGAVVGKVFWPDAIVAQGPIDGRLEDLLLEAARRDLVSELDDRGLGGGRTWTFKHILIRDVAYDAIPKADRSRAHDTFGRWLERTAGERVVEYADIVAYHAEQSFLLARELGETDASALGRRAFDALMAAGNRARHRSDQHAQLAYFRRATSIAREIEVPPIDRVAASGFAAGARFTIESSDEALAEVRSLIPEARAAGPSEALVELLLHSSSVLLDDLDAAAALDREAVAVARAIDDADTLAMALFRSHSTPWMAGDLEAQRVMLIAALDHMRASGARRLEFGCLNWLSNNAYYRGDFAAAHAYHREAERRVAEGSSPMQRMFATRARATWAWVGGDFENGEALAREQLRLARDLGLRGHVGVSCWWVGFVLRDKGDLAGARAAFEDSVATLDSAAAQGLRAEARAQLSPICLALGDLDAARAHAERARAEVTEDDAFTQATSRSALAQVRAAEGRFLEAEQLFTDGLKAIARTGYGAVQADLRREYGAFLLARGRLADARRELEAARAFYDSDLVRVEREKIDALLGRAAVSRAASSDRS